MVPTKQLCMNLAVQIFEMSRLLAVVSLKELVPVALLADFYQQYPIVCFTQWNSENSFILSLAH